ncbi:uncharacterized protein BDW70DRAFT_135051 [Aspergillus foveolatus]|uniref:uncharacterized protein n=1 Tax=Aspergillus foveolatus TaxID=210207 RepID=UPI003CCD3E68
MPPSASQPEPERELEGRTRQTNKPYVRRTPRHRLALRQLHIRVRDHAFQVRRHGSGEQR